MFKKTPQKTLILPANMTLDVAGAIVASANIHYQIQYVIIY
jgi:hypothetical protein